MKKQAIAKKFISLVLGLVMIAGFAVPVAAQQLAIENNWKTAVISPSGMAIWYVDNDNVLWGRGGRPNSDYISLGDGANISGVRPNFVRIMENVAYIAFVNDCPTT